ncbi:MAG TPA: beta-propeller fold lactonase family protein, partial [Methyloversatilis sp.]
VGNHPFALELSADGRTLWALNVYSNDVSVVDVGQARTVATLPVGKAPYGIALSEDGARAYVTNQQSDSVSVIDTARRQVIATWPSVVYPEGVAVSGEHLLVVSWMDDLVGVFDARTGRPEGTVAVGRNPRGFGRFIHRSALAH